MFCVIWTFGSNFEVIANLVKSLWICLIWLTDLQKFTIGDATQVSVETEFDLEQHDNIASNTLTKVPVY